MLFKKLRDSVDVEKLLINYANKACLWELREFSSIIHKSFITFCAVINSSAAVEINDLQKYENQSTTNLFIKEIKWFNRHKF